MVKALNTFAALLVLSLVCLCLGVETKTKDTVGPVVVVPFSSTASLSISVASSSSFRLAVRFNSDIDSVPSPIDAPTLSPDAPASSKQVSWGGMTGLSTSFGALLASPEGKWVLYDASNTSLVWSGASPYLDKSGIMLPVNGSGQVLAPDGQPCMSNGDFGPQYFWARDLNFMAMAVPELQYDPVNPHCYPATYNGDAPGLYAGDDVGACSLVQQNNRDVDGSQRSDKYPNGASVSSYSDCCAACGSDSSCTSFVYATDGESPNCWPLKGYSSTHSASNRMLGMQPGSQAWWALGSDAADWYLSPTPNGGHSMMKNLMDLTGANQLPMLSAFGFMGTYWGYTSFEDVQSNMTAFRSGNYPIDIFIEDYDWWRDNEADEDFNYAPNMWCIDPTCGPPVNSNSAAETLAYWKKALNMKWIGIRKPRTYSNIDYCKSQGWLLPPSSNVGAGGNNFNFSVPAFQNWYVNNSLHFIKDGILAWWNDEGETSWETYLLWNELEFQEIQQARAANARTFSINRSFQPGMQRYAAVTWTGDRQDCSSPTMLGFVIKGQPWVTCDMTSPSATILVRQYQHAVWWPTMRVHQMHGTPRFPYLWGGEEHQTAFRDALNLRYRIIPHLYGLAHQSNVEGTPIVQPASFLYPASELDPTVGDVTWVFGDSIYPADTCVSNSPSSQENTTTTHLPPGTFFEFNATTTAVGPQTIVHTNVPITTMHVHVKAGSIVVLNREVVQYTEALGGALEVHVYGGGNAEFVSVEDDGESTDYQNGATRRTTWSYDDATKTLKWSVSGSYATPRWTTVVPVLFESNATAPVWKTETTIGMSGSVSF